MKSVVFEVSEMTSEMYDFVAGSVERLHLILGLKQIPMHMMLRHGNAIIHRN